MKLSKLFETKLNEESYTVDPKQKAYIDEIAQVLFGKEADFVKDTKRSKEPIFYGVADERSNLAVDGKVLRLTFDNSTDSGEYEINSLTPYKIKKGSEEDSKIKKLYRKFRLASKEKIKYLAVDEYFILREVYLGTEITEDAVRFVKGLVRILNKDEDEDDSQDETPKKAEPKKDVESKPEPKPEVKEKPKAVEPEEDSKGKE